MSTMVGAPRTPACRRADRDREAHGTAVRGQWDAARVHRPQNVTAGTKPVPPPRGNRLGVRPRGPAGRDGYKVDAMIGAPVYPLANRTCPHWPNSASRQAAGSSMRKTYSAILFAGRGAAESVSSSAVLDHDHAETIVSEGTVQPDCRSDQRVRAKRPASHGQRPARPAPSGRTPARGPVGETHGPSPSTVASTRPRRHQTKRWPAAPSAPSPTSAGPDDGRP